MPNWTEILIAAENAFDTMLTANGYNYNWHRYNRKDLDRKYIGVKALFASFDQGSDEEVIETLDSRDPVGNGAGTATYDNERDFFVLFEVDNSFVVAENKKLDNILRANELALEKAKDDLLKRFRTPELSNSQGLGLCNVTSFKFNTYSKIKKKSGDELSPNQGKIIGTCRYSQTR